MPTDTDCASLPSPTLAKRIQKEGDEIFSIDCTKARGALVVVEDNDSIAS